MSLEQWNNGGKEEADKFLTETIKLFQEQPLYRRIALSIIILFKIEAVSNAKY